MSVTWNANWPTLTLEIEFDGASYTDVTSYVRSLRIERPTSRETGRYPAGTLMVTLDNRDGRFSPFNTSGPYTSGGATQVLPDVRVRLSASWSATTYYLFCGHTEDWQDEYPEKGYDAVTVLTCVDPLAQLAATERVAQTADGEGERMADRADRILTGLSVTLGSASVGDAPLQATTLEGNALDECYLVTDSDGGALWYDPSASLGTFGGLVFESRSALAINSRSNTSQATFGTGGVPVADFTTSAGRDQILLSASYANVDGEFQTVGSGVPSRVRSDLIAMNDPDAMALAELAVAVGDPASAPRVTSVTILPAGDPTTAFPHVLGRRIRDRVTVNVTIPSSSLTINKQVFIDGITHQIDQFEWTTTFVLQSATAWDGFSASTWDSGLWDTAKWFY